ncbi:hypothetical protein EFQU50X_01324 [Enterococcus faecium]|nr:hypothetical protein EFQU50X_01324 [Enterococcus faecium]
METERQIREIGKSDEYDRQPPVVRAFPGSQVGS